MISKHCVHVPVDHLDIGEHAERVRCCAQASPLLVPGCNLTKTTVIRASRARGIMPASSEIVDEFRGTEGLVSMEHTAEESG